MKVCIHIQPAGEALGGGQGVAVHLAGILRGRHQVEIVHHRPQLQIGDLAAFAGINLDGVSSRYVPHQPNYFLSRASGPVARWLEPPQWGRTLAGDADTLISLTHAVPPWNPTPRGVVYLLFPMTSPLEDWPLAPAPGGETWRTHINRAAHASRYQSLWRGYQTRLAISDFSAEWGRKRWGVPFDILPPFVDCTTDRGVKEVRVLSVARFAVDGVSKAQLDMAGAFAESVDLQAWQFECVGSAVTSAEMAYAEAVRAVNARVLVTSNASRGAVRAAFARARIFWHAAGLHADEQAHPELMEHFGIVTVEAMANGCVPVVIGRGGQREIIEHGVSGYLCESLAEMVAHTRALSRDEGLLARMSSAARHRARLFDLDEFTAGFRAHVPYL